MSKKKKRKRFPKVTIAMPVYNGEKYLAKSIRSAMDQDYPNKKIVVSDDCSVDQTPEIAQSYPVKFSRKFKNEGLGENMNTLMFNCNTDYIIFLCQDDVFTHKSVISDMMYIFTKEKKVGVIGRYYYQYIDGYKGAVMTIRTDINISSCNPSCMGFRKKAMDDFHFSNKLFVEMPSMVKKVTDAGWKSIIMPYDTVAACLHFGDHPNAAIDTNYFKTAPEQSPTKNWYDILGTPFIYSLGLIQLKNRFPQILLREIRTSIQLQPLSLINPKFIACALIALIVPRKALIHLSNFYRHRITRHFVRIIEREESWLKSQ